MKKGTENEETIVGKYSLPPASPQTDRWGIMIATIAECARCLGGYYRKENSSKKVGSPFQKGGIPLSSLNA